MLRQSRTAHRSLLALVVCLVAAALTACGGATQPGSAAAAPAKDAAKAAAPLDACAVLSQDEASAAMGIPMLAPRPGAIQHAGDAETASVSSCRFEPEDGGLDDDSSLLVRRAPTDENSPASIAATRDTVKSMAKGEPQDVASVGDTAFWGAHQLHVFSDGRFYVIVSVYGFDDATALAKAKQLATTVLARL